MLGLIAITPWHWVGFILFVIGFIALDLGAFQRRAHAVSFFEAFVRTAICFGLAMLFAAGMAHWRGREDAEAFTTGYLIEVSLSLDNLLVIALIFEAFRVPAALQHRVLLWGILGALVMRGAMIAAGAALVQQFDWVLYLFGAFLIFAGVKMLFDDKELIQPKNNPILRLTRRFLPVAPDYDGAKFLTRRNARLMLTPLALVLIVVETSDLIFAVDSVPAVFSVTRKAFIVFTSNVFAILGLRSLYFLLAGALDYFRYLKFGLSFVLVVIGLKMLLEPHGPQPKWFQVEIPTGVSLMTVAAIITSAVVLSVMVSEREKRRAGKKNQPQINTDGHR